jgi:hypothetical protein
VLERARDRWGAEAVAGRLLHAYEGLRGRPKRFVRGVRGGVKAGARL